MQENGSSFLYVTSDCSFFVRPVTNLWDEVRSGHLTPDEQRETGNDLAFDSWRGLAGDWYAEPLVSDSSVYVYMPGLRRESMISCHNLCAAEPVPAALQTATRNLPSLIQRLWQNGEALSGSVRYVLIADTELWPDFFPVQGWPLSLDPDSVAIDWSSYVSQWGNNGHIASGADAAALRELRRKYREWPLAGTLEFIPVRNGDKQYRLFFRDSLPFEDAQGLVRPQ